VTIVGKPPLVGLDRLLRRAGFGREQFKITTTTEYVQESGEHAILALGEEALRFLVGEAGILRWSGRVARGLQGQWVIPSLHPFHDLLPRKGKAGGQLRNPSRFTGASIFHLKKALDVARNGFTRQEPRYLCDPSPEQFALWVIEFENALEREGVMLSWDIETPYKLKEKDEDEFEESLRDTVIVRISFAYRPGTGVSVPWTPAYLPSIQRLLRSRGAHVVWNGDCFDVPLVRSQGLEVAGEVQDYMWGWHTYQSDLPMGLEFVSSFWSDILPWKHLNNSDPVLYSAIDADAALRNALGIRDALKRTGQWDTFHRHVVQLNPILTEAGANGSKIDLEKQGQLRRDLTKLRAELIEQAQGVVPEEIKPRKRYKKLPKSEEFCDGRGVPQGTTVVTIGTRKFEAVHTSGKVKRCSHCGLEGVKKSDHFKGGKKNPCKAANATITDVPGNVIEWDEILPFNPNSTEQIKAYIRHFNHPMGRAKDDRDKEAADSRHLEKLKKKHGDSHPLYGLTIQLHKVSKALSTYVEGFAPDSHGYIHTTYTPAPSTGRLSSRNVNLQNVGKRETNKWAKDARKQIVARPGHVFVQGDSSAIEAVLVGYFMGSPEYIDMARAGIHDRLACYKLGIPFNPVNKGIVKSQYGTLRDQCKITVHGTSYCMTPKLMVELFPDLCSRQSEEAEGIPGRVYSRWCRG
jgi:hypothetical protein